mmetsp:Transcript_34986/g.73806  ORF Transcript_34986/g.73806 Transcript_34986/m.73806 type:complete len:333 (+) Transcript_34986:52-1050(+)
MTMLDNLERQLEELEVLEAIYPDELTINVNSVEAARKLLVDSPEDMEAAINSLPKLSFTINLAPLACLEQHTGELKHVQPSIVVEFPPQYPENDPPLVTKTIGIDSKRTELMSAIEMGLDDHSGEECIMQLITSLNEEIEAINEQTANDHERGVQLAKEKEQERKAKSIREADDAITMAVPVIGRRIINSPYILKPAKIKDIKKFADELKLGGYAKVGKPGIIVIEGPEEGCKQYCPMLEDRGWKYQKVQGEQQEEGAPNPGGSVEGMRLIKEEFRVLEEDSMSELSQLCREAGLADFFFASLNIHNSVVDDRDGGVLVNNRGRTGKKGGKR